MLTKVLSTLLEEEWKQDTSSVFNIEALFFVSSFKLFKVAIKLCKKLAYFPRR